MSLTESIITVATAVISATGYGGVFLLMALESMIAPIPSEAVMPFAGFLIAEGTFSLLGVIVASTAGSLFGSLLSYWIGRYGGRYLVDRFGKYVFLNHHHLDRTERFFARYGEKTVFISRFIPIVRHLISIPAGVGEMQMRKFLLYTALGAGLWNTFLAYLGYVLGSRWESVRHWSEWLDVLLVVCALLLILAFVPKLRRKLRKKR